MGDYQETTIASKVGRLTEKLEQTKASARAKVEHCFHVVKCLFRHRKIRYRSLAKCFCQSGACAQIPW